MRMVCGWLVLLHFCLLACVLGPHTACTHTHTHAHARAPTGYITDYYGELAVSAQVHILYCLCDWLLDHNVVDRFRRSVMASSPQGGLSEEEDEITWVGRRR
jgi:hypothetical protein